MKQEWYDRMALWTLRAFAWVSPVLSWLILHDLQTLGGRGYWTFFWPIWLTGAAMAFGIEIYRKHNRL